MKIEKELTSFAKEVVDQCQYSFLSKKDLINNFKDYGFLVNENSGIGYTSYLEYDKKSGKGLLSFSKEESEKFQKRILLTNFCAFLLSDEEKVKFYYQDIPSKRRMKILSKCLIEKSVEKEFPEDIDTFLIKEEEPRKGRSI